MHNTLTPKQAAVARMGGIAEQRAEEGHCCAEAMLAAVLETYWSKQHPPLAHLVAGLCGGMGNKQATCGVFTGGAVAIGLVAGGPAGKGRDGRIKSAAACLHQRLSQEAGGQICGEILDHMGIANWDKRLCRRLTRRGAEILAEILDEGGWPAPLPSPDPEP
jgi:C_GCAxxG_C_C family probable redox protein